MKIIYDGGQPHELIIDERDLERIIRKFRAGSDLREAIINVMKLQGYHGVNFNKVWIYYDQTNA